MSKTDEVTKVRILEQAEMVLNVQSNFNLQKESVLDIFENFNEVLKDMGTSKEFQKSLNTSKNCYEDNSKVLGELEKLKTNNDDSFLIVPLLAQGHLFSTVVKKYEENGMEKYSALVVNLGSREAEKGEHHKYEEFVFDSPKRIINTLNFNKPIIPVNEIYKNFIKNSKEQYINGINSRDQITGNCYLKEVEKGIKASLISMYIVANTRITYGTDLNNLKVKLLPAKFKVNGMTYDTEMVHYLYLDKLAKKHPEATNEINAIKKSYEVNKKIHNYLEGKSAVRVSQNEIYRNIDIKTMQTVIYNQNNPKLGEIFGHVDNTKFSQMGEFVDMRRLVLKVMKNDISVYKDFLSLSNEAKEKFPRLVDNLKKGISELLGDKGSEILQKFDKTGKEEDFKIALLCNEKAIELYPHNSGVVLELGFMYKMMGKNNEATKCFETALLYRTEPFSRNGIMKNLNNLYAQECCIEIEKSNLMSAMSSFNKLDKAGEGKEYIKILGPEISQILEGHSRRGSNLEEAKNVVNEFFGKHQELLQDKIVMLNMAKTLENIGVKENRNAKNEISQKYIATSSEMFYEYGKTHITTISEKIEIFNHALALNPANSHVKEIQEFFAQNQKHYNLEPNKTDYQIINNENMNIDSGVEPMEIDVKEGIRFSNDMNMTLSQRRQVKENNSEIKNSKDVQMSREEIQKMLEPIGNKQIKRLKQREAKEMGR